MNGSREGMFLTPAEGCQSFKKKPQVIQLSCYISAESRYLAEDGLHSVGVKPHLTLPTELLVVHLTKRTHFKFLL